MKKNKGKLVLLSLFLSIAPMVGFSAPVASYDICVYGGNSAGVIAAVQAKKIGKSVLLISPDKHLGGLTSGGLGFTDMGDEKTVGGMSREYFHRLWQYYQKPEAWKFQSRAQFGNSGQHGPAFNQELEIATVFEPHVAEKIFNDLIAENGIEVIQARLDLNQGVEKSGNRIGTIRMEDGRTFAAKVFIDATYEGDLMAGAGVKYTVGREPNLQYHETANGIQKDKPGNQLPKGIDPYLKKGDPSSGLLPRVNATAGGQNGEGDKRVQAYCYRMCLTDVVENVVPVSRPADYREEDYEILFRAIEAGQKNRFFKLSLLPNRKTDSNNDSGISTDYIGMNDLYPEADYATRSKIAEAHKNWQLGLIWTVQNHPRVPESIRKAYAKWGLPKDEFTDNNNWSFQLYVREARRMVNDHVITENDILKRVTPQSVGMGSYKMDSHNVQYHLNSAGFISAEGDVQKEIKGSYQIDYQSMVPKKEECENLLVPVCLAASHIAYGSIRMEPVFMVLGQSAATAAALSLDTKTLLQDLSYEKLKEQLTKDGQVLEISSAPANPKTSSAEANSSFFKNLQDGRKQNVVLYGTSLTAQGAWAKEIKKWFDEHYPGLVTVWNTAGPGQNSDWGLQNLQTHVLDHQPDLIFIEFSYNDAHDKFHLPVERGAANLDAMVKAITAQNPHVIVVLQVMNIGWDAPNGNRSQSVRPKLETFNDNYRSYARAQNLPLLDHYADWRALKESNPEQYKSYVPDGTHPNEQGSLAITWPMTRDWLEKQSSSPKAP